MYHKFRMESNVILVILLCADSLHAWTRTTSDPCECEKSVDGTYVVCNVIVNATDAHNYCSRRCNGSLGSIKSEAEFQEIYDTIGEIHACERVGGKSQRAFYIGASDGDEEGAWRWIGDGSLLDETHSRWKVVKSNNCLSQPDQQNICGDEKPANQDYAVLQMCSGPNFGTWFDVIGNISRPFICKLKVNVSEKSRNCPQEMLQCDNGKKCIRISNFCDGHKECSDGSDEPYAASYQDNGTLCRRSTIPSRLCLLPPELQQEKQFLCTDEIRCSGQEFECQRTSPTCIPASKFCDGLNDCSNGSDEVTSSSAANSGHRTCFGIRSKEVGKGPCHLREKYFCDGESICAKGIDESCGQKSEDHLDESWFRCFESSTIVPIANVCDGKFDCSDLTDECLCQSTGRPEICERLRWERDYSYLQCKQSNHSKRLDVNAAQLCDMNSDCHFVETEKHCKDDYGLIYKDCYASKSGIGNCSYNIGNSVSSDSCLGDNAHCSVFLNQHQLARINSNSSWITCSVDNLNSSSECDIGYDCTTVPDQNVTMLKKCKNQGVNFTEGYFRLPCNCTYFKCDDEKYIHGRAVCDGFMDCTSGIDECQQGCLVSAFSDENSMITNKGVMALVWIFSIIAITGCTSVVATTLHGIVTSTQRPANSSHSSINKLLIMSLSISDLLVGIYTMSICIKAIDVEGNYCNVDIEWRTSTTCSILGALLIIGSEQSVFTMVLITTFRLIAVARPLYRPQFRQAIRAVMISWLISIPLGLIPLLATFEDYFLKDVLFNDTVIFKTKVNRNDKQRLINWLGFLNYDGIHEQGDSTEWENLRRLVSQINKANPIKTAYEFGYYSSHTVCLPTFFPDRNTDGSWLYSFGLLLFNFLAFVFMIVCYISLYRKATNRKIVKSSTAQDKQHEKSAALQRKLTRILASDFLCWMPVCIMGFLQLAGIDIPTDAYLPTGLLILPINSALNPFLYSDLPDIILIRGRRLIAWLAVSFRRCRSKGSSSEIPSTQVEALELNVVGQNRDGVVEMD